ncbi:CoA transferase [Brevibacterium aurantiacum]|uniref:2-methylfumaryl-CoA isomerase n=1 Tax=Brevibacterium aurantiacum TaxID=273384 RepID=A0A2A3X492_BREAU|nr:CoA transferase [Brevibacterium aurantiacum]AZT95818.1 2-methylfumaryl-CoA isomerase [Brevibacterium aurantiacum]PCC18488.1 2-methylfumaryl-CoA isomerase [Brevibacterium aurantiacum]RCS87584.1 2-methylfumaryl-CoA isomerase [Brevibacterium aurantiacum]
MPDTRPAPLAGLKVIEISAFVAAPLGAMTLAQLGADVIRIDPLGGNIDANRWPISDDGTSIYWASLNKGKRSVTLDLKSDEGQKIATDLIAEAGTLVTNLPARGWLSYENLVQHREDLVMLRLNGSHDGKPAVDYTINAASGFPIITGDDERPVNNAIPAWDVIAGLYIANGITAAELDRRTSGKGQEINMALSDAMLATVGNLGYIAEVQATGKTRGPLGNGLYGAYGQSFTTSDGREIMVAVISNKHWRGLGQATGLSEKLEMIGPMLDVDLSTEGGRFEAREAIDAVVRPWFAAHTAAEAAAALSGAGVLQGEFQTFEELVNNDPWCSLENPLFSEIEQQGVGTVLAPRVPLSFSGTPAAAAVPAPRLGGDTESVLADVLGLRVDVVAGRKPGGVSD